MNRLGLILLAALPVLSFGQGLEAESVSGRTVFRGLDAAVFEANRGQHAAEAGDFVLQLGRSFVGVHHDHLSFVLRDATDERTARFLMTFEGASVAAKVERGLPAEGVRHYLLGDDPTRHVKDVPLSSTVRIVGIYPGIDIVVAAPPGGGVKYDLVAAPGADLAQVAVRFVGAEVVAADASGVRISTALGEVRHTIPASWEVLPGGERRALEATHAKDAGDRVRFVADGRRLDREAVIDPLVWSTFLGGPSNEEQRKVKLDAAGNVYVAGSAYNGFPATPGTFATTTVGGGDTTITKFSPSGSLLWATYLGGSSSDVPSDMFVDETGEVTVCGESNSTNFPTTPGAFDVSLNGFFDNTITRLSATGSTLVWSTFLGGNSSEGIAYIAKDPTGGFVVVGRTDSSNFPYTPGAFDTISNSSNYDAFVTRFNDTGSAILYSTFLGGSYDDEGRGVAVSATGVITVCGNTSSLDFPVTPGAYDVTSSWAGDCFVARIAPGGAALSWATLFGGNSFEFVSDMHVHDDGSVVVAGEAISSDFPTTPGAYDTTRSGPSDGFVLKLNSTGSALAFSTLLGGSSYDSGIALHVDATGVVTLGGITLSATFPTTPGAFSTTMSGSADMFISRLSPDGATLLWSTFFGGAATVGSFEGLYSIAVDPFGGVVLCGAADAALPTTPGAFSTTYGGGPAFDGFVARIDDDARKVATIGAGAAPLGAPWASLVRTLPALASAVYVFDIGFGGTSPGLTIAPGVVVPLNPPYLNLDFGVLVSTAYPNAIQGFIGTTNAAGEATAIFTPPNDPLLNGVVFWSTAVVLDPASPFGIYGAAAASSAVLTP